MSVFQFQASAALPILVRVTGNTAKTIVDATGGALLVPWFQVVESTGSGTHNLTVDIYDGTNAIYIGSDAGSAWIGKAVTGGLSVLFSQGYVIPKGSLLRVTSSDAAGKFHVVGVTVRSGTA